MKITSARFRESADRTMLCSCLFARCRKHWVCTSSSCRVWCRKKCVLAFLCACSCTRFFAFQHACLCSACMRYANTMTSLTWNWGVWHEICCENPNLTCSPGICQFDLFTCLPGIFPENDGPRCIVFCIITVRCGGRWCSWLQIVTVWLIDEWFND